MAQHSEHQLNIIREEAGSDIKRILKELEDTAPGVTEGIASIVGCTAGGAASFAALTTLGTAGISAAGITSGLATAGGMIGGGMVAGIGVLAAPVAILGIGAYALAKRYKQSKLTAALSKAIEKLYSVQRRMMQNAEYFKSELASLIAVIDMLKDKKSKL